jgi:hypothetical protein
MTQWIKKPEYAETVVIPNNEFGDHPMHGWAETPDWLQKAFDDRVISPRFGGEDYWYYDVKSNGRTYPGAPDDLIVRNSDGSLDVRKKHNFEIEYDKVPENALEGLPVYLPDPWNAKAQIGTATVSEDGVLHISVPDNLVREYVIDATDRKLIAVAFVYNEAYPH